MRARASKARHNPGTCRAAATPGLLHPGPGLPPPHAHLHVEALDGDGALLAHAPRPPDGLLLQRRVQRRLLRRPGGGARGRQRRDCREVMGAGTTAAHPGGWTAAAAPRRPARTRAGGGRAGRRAGKGAGGPLGGRLGRAGGRGRTMRKTCEAAVRLMPTAPERVDSRKTARAGVETEGQQAGGQRGIGRDAARSGRAGCRGRERSRAGGAARPGPPPCPARPASGGQPGLGTHPWWGGHPGRR